ncbi:MAG: ABC transporter ATP-binding protein [Propionibacteriaceae bacterium]|nr:ABC transporter ATP-binding protein [Micropruina sp.]HBX82231.1 ABC transporter ATP-binding protein [Propionibacteriaceae bacterium]HBY22444.1 ABC transporter ATP-binding protein [Propionibacteriaceae bacterium]
MNPLELHGLTKHYPGFTLDLSLTVPRGYVMGFVGANGSGKTTTIKCALGLVRPDAGTVTLAPKSVIGVVLDQPSYVADWTVATTGRLLSRFYPSWDADRFAALTDGAGVPSKRRIKELSRGMGMKLQLAVALSHGAEFLILDEPTSGLDPFARDQLLEGLAEFMTDENHSVLFSTHITSDLDKIADYVTVIDAGRVVTSSTLDDLVESYRLASGGPDDLPLDLSGLVIGLRRHRTGWDGLVATDDAASLGRHVQLEEPTLDDIVVRIAKERAHV